MTPLPPENYELLQALKLKPEVWASLPPEVQSKLEALHRERTIVQSALARLRIIAGVLAIALGIALVIIMIVGLPLLLPTPDAGENPESNGISLILPETPREAFANIDSYAVYYGQGQRDALAQFDAVIIQPETLETADLLTLTNSGTMALAYLSIGEVEPTRSWYTDGRVASSWILGENPNWGSFYVNVNAPGWQDLMIDLAGQYLTRGFNGVFLDTVDTVDLYPSTRNGMVELIQRFRETFPNAIVVQNRGFTVMDETASLVDGIMIESLTTSYDFATSSYVSVPVNTYTDLIARLQGLHQETGLVVLALDYAAPSDVETVQTARQAAQMYGFISAVSEITLQQVPTSG